MTSVKVKNSKVEDYKYHYYHFPHPGTRRIFFRKPIKCCIIL